MGYILATSPPETERVLDLWGRVDFDGKKNVICDGILVVFCGCWRKIGNVGRNAVFHPWAC